MNDYVISETLAKPGEPLNRTCLHLQHVPPFNAAAARPLPPEQVREKWPKYDSVCTACGQQCRIWANITHMKALGDM